MNDGFSAATAPDVPVAPDVPHRREWIAARAEDLFSNHQKTIYQRTDRLFAALMILEWVGGIFGAMIISPRVWSGSFSQTHIHVWAALFLGAAIIIVPVALAMARPGRVS